MRARLGTGESLSERDREILRDVIHTYLKSGEPVSSRRVAKHEVHDLSAASIRNVMADLEELGYLRQPHTSAGRVPTAQGYHLFIDSLMRQQELSPEDRRQIEAELNRAVDHPGSAASELLSRLSCMVGIVITPDHGSAVLQSVEFVPLSGRKVLCVAVTTGGFIDHKIVELDEPLSREELIEVSNYLTSSFAMMTLQEMRDRVLELMEDARAQVDQLLRRSISLAQKGLDFGRGPELVVQGTESLLNQPELADLSRVRRLFETFADKSKVVRLLNRWIEGEGVRVLIGHESDLTSELDFSLIFKSFKVDGHSIGGVGLFGPSRMEYQRLIPLVNFLGNRLATVIAAERA